MKLVRAILLLLCANVAFAQGMSPFSSPFIEDLTWVEVRDAVASGKTTALYYAGSTEQNGPHMATGKHNLIAKYVAGKIATELGNALIYPVLPFAPTGDAIKKTEHMAYAGSVSISDETFARLARETAQSAEAAGFKCIVLMGDHGGGQAALGLVAKELSAQWRKEGIRVIHASDVYERSNQMAMALLKTRGLPYGDHASTIDTSELMFVAPYAVRLGQRSAANAATGSSGYAQQATAALGKQLIGFKVRAAVEQIRAGCGR
jgi:creatinine amidohydrolase/Fe(II)-dependent formamide hydrolase-like protein